ncbi:MAG: hypothetical protein QXE62_07535 [Candidatus Nitrosocaldaceae archaeon]
MTDMSAVVPLQASINAGSRVGFVIGSKADMQRNSIATGEGYSSLGEELSEVIMDAMYPCMSAKEIHSNNAMADNKGKDNTITHL